MNEINEQIATVLAAIIALGLALRAGVGPVVMYLTEAVKDAFKPPAGWGGIISVLIGMILGVTLGLLTALTTPDTPLATFMAFGAVAGLFMASGAIETHKAAGQVNARAKTAVNVEQAETVVAEPMAPAETPSTPFFFDTEPAEWEEADWEEARLSSGHTGEAVEVEPLPDIGEPSDRYRGVGPPA